MKWIVIGFIFGPMIIDHILWVIFPEKQWDAIYNRTAKDPDWNRK